MIYYIHYIYETFCLGKYIFKNLTCIFKLKKSFGFWIYGLSTFSSPRKYSNVQYCIQTLSPTYT